MSADADTLLTSGSGDRADFLRYCLSDFRRFAGLVKIVDKSGQRIPFTLNDIQKTYCGGRTQRDVVLKPRQIGFTTLEQVRDVYAFLTKPGSRVVTTCQSLSDHSPKITLAKNYAGIFRSLQEAGIQIPFTSEASGHWAIASRDSTLSILEAGASQASAEKKGRAGTVTRLHSTETAFYEYAESTLNALLECVPGPEHGSEVVFESTPNGASGVFYQYCQDATSGKSGYKLHFYPWFAQREYSLRLDPGEQVRPRTEREQDLVSLGVTPEQLKWYQRKLAEKSGNQDKMDQEYASDPHTCFLVSGRGFFDAGTVQGLLKLVSPPLERAERGTISVWHKPERGRRYVVSADPSEGTGGDPGAAIVFRDDGVHCATIHGQLAPWDMARILVHVSKLYNRALIIPERNNHGHAVIQAIIRELQYRRVYVHRDEKPGWPTDSVTRPMMLDEFEAAVRTGRWRSPDERVLKELQHFIVNDVGKPEADKGFHDDLVMASAIGWAVLHRPRTQRDLDGLPPA